jgi:hypothetical protein
MVEPAHPDAATEAPASSASVRARVKHLRALANTVEQEDPVLACELRGIAQHESSLTVPAPPSPPARWKRLPWRRAAAPAWG